MLRPIQIVATTLALAAMAWAQQPKMDDDPEVAIHAQLQTQASWAERWLRSGEPNRVAWGAWLIRHDHWNALIPVLVDEVEKYQSSRESLPDGMGRDRHDALLVVLDALIALQARIPADQAHKLYPEFPAQSLILLVNSADSSPFLLDIFHRAQANWNWLAAGNALAKAHSRGFAAALLGRFTQHIAVWVVTGNAGAGGGIGGGGSECGFSLRGPKQGWPPVGLYQLFQFPDRFPWLRSTLLLNGETPVYYLRVETGNYDNPPDLSAFCDGGNRDEYRAQYLNGLLFPSHISLSAYAQKIIQWSNAANFREQLEQIVQTERIKFSSAVASLEQSGALTPEEVKALAPRIEIVVNDARADRATALPELSKSGLSARVLSSFTRPLD